MDPERGGRRGLVGEGGGKGGNHRREVWGVGILTVEAF